MLFSPYQIHVSLSSWRDRPARALAIALPDEPQSYIGGFAGNLSGNPTRGPAFSDVPPPGCHDGHCGGHDGRHETIVRKTPLMFRASRPIQP